MDAKISRYFMILPGSNRLSYYIAQNKRLHLPHTFKVGIEHGALKFGECLGGSESGFSICYPLIFEAIENLVIKRLVFCGNLLLHQPLVVAQALE